MAKEIGEIFTVGVGILLVGCSSLPASPLDKTKFSAMEAQYQVHGCRLLPTRVAECDVSTTNFNQAKTIRTGGIKIRDNVGNDYAAEDPGAKPRLYAPEENYRFVIRATNISSQATSIKMIQGGFYVRSTGSDRKYLGFGAGTPQNFYLTGMQTKTRASESKQATSAQKTPRLASGTQTGSGAQTSSTIDRNAWQLVGYWDYDAVDGQYISQGLFLKNQPGSGAGSTWLAHLELKNHASLPARQRSLWPVHINPGLHKVCANYPGYPTYQVYIDLPGDANDGIYTVSECKGS